MRIFACFAATLDGKIGSAAYPDDRIGSRDDLTHLLTVRNQADALLYGGETFRQWPALRKGNQQEAPPIQCLMTKSFNLPADVPLFQQAEETGATIIIVSPTEAPKAVRDKYPSHIQWLTTDEEQPLPTILADLEKRGVNTLMVEGGGHIMHMALQAKIVQELYLTVCPLFLAGADNPSLVTGPGFRVGEAPRTEVLSQAWKGEELYLHLQLKYTN